MERFWHEPAAKALPMVKTALRALTSTAKAEATTAATTFAAFVQARSQSMAAIETHSRCVSELSTLYLCHTGDMERLRMCAVQ